MLIQRTVKFTRLELVEISRLELVNFTQPVSGCFHSALTIHRIYIRSFLILATLNCHLNSFSLLF